MTDVNTHKPNRTQPEHCADCDAHQPSEIRLSDSYSMLSHSNINYLHFIISVKNIFIISILFYALFSWL